MNTQSEQKHLNETLRELFRGSEDYYKHATGYHYTEGVKYVAETCESYWLIDEIAFINYPKEIEEFQVWKLTREFTKEGIPKDSFSLCCEDGNDNIVFSKTIPFSDFKHDSVEIWYCNEVIYLPSEH